MLSGRHHHMFAGIGTCAEAAMSLRPLAVYRVPEETARIAHAASPKGNSHLRIRDELGPISEDHAFADLFATRGRSAIAPAQLALVTILQCAEGLSDKQAADAVRGRIDWKYVLSLDLDDPGFDASVRCGFRPRLLAGERAALLLDTLLTLCREHGLLKAHGRQRRGTRARAATHVLAAVQALNRFEVVGETLRHARTGTAGVGRAVCPPRRRRPPAGQEGGLRRTGADHRGRWLYPTRGRVRRRQPGVGTRDPDGGHAPPGLGAAIPPR
jgi:transposase